MDAKSLLDELMGKDRDLPLDQQKKKKVTFDDPEVCRYYLAAFCPHDLFPNTKSDLGPCPKIHDDALREPYLKSSRVPQFEAELLSYLERLIADLERKIRRCHERLDKEIPMSEPAKENGERITAIAVEVQALLRQAEKDGEDGRVDQAEATMAKVEALNKEKDTLMKARLAIPDRTLGPNGATMAAVMEKEKRMQVCHTCGAMQASTDTDKRLASHLEGKQHIGYFRIRQMAEQLKKKREDDRERRRLELAPDGRQSDSAGGAATLNEDGDRLGKERRDREDARNQHSKDQKWDADKKAPEHNRDRDRDRGRERDWREKHRETDDMRERDREREGLRERDRDRDRDRGRGRGREAGWERERGRDHEREGARSGGKEREREKSRERERAGRGRDQDRRREREDDASRSSRLRRSRSRERLRRSSPS